MSDLLSANIGDPQSDMNLPPQTIASAATIAPSTKMTILTGTVQLETVTPPVTGYHTLVLLFTNAAPGAFVTTGNLITAYQPIQNRPVTLHYLPATGKYYVAAVA